MARFLAGVLACAALTIWAAVATAQTERRVALVIGNGKYDHLARLPNPANNAQLIATTLQSVGFELIGNTPRPISTAPASNAQSANSAPSWPAGRSGCSTTPGMACR